MLDEAIDEIRYTFNKPEERPDHGSVQFGCRVCDDQQHQYSMAICVSRIVTNICKHSVLTGLQSQYKSERRFLKKNKHQDKHHHPIYGSYHLVLSTRKSKSLIRSEQYVIESIDGWWYVRGKYNPNTNPKTHAKKAAIFLLPEALK